MSAFLLLALLQAPEEPVLRLEHGTDVVQVAFQPGGILATASRQGDDMTVMAWDPATAMPRRRIAVPPEERMNFVSFARHAPLFAASHSDGTIRVWNLAEGGTISSIASPRPFARICVSPDGRLVAAAGNGIRIHDATTGGAVSKLEGSRFPGPMRFSPDGRFLAAVQSPSGIGRWETATGRALPALPAAFH